MQIPAPCQSFRFDYNEQQWVAMAQRISAIDWKSALATNYHPDEATLYTRLEAGYNIAVNCCVLSGKCD